MGVKKPRTFHYDFMIAGLTNILLGLLGLPPINGVLPQSPMHTRSLIYKVKARKLENKNGIMKRVRSAASSLSSSFRSFVLRDGKNKETETFVENSEESEKESNASDPTTIESAGDSLGKKPEAIVTFEVAEQRFTNLLQSLLIAATMFLTALIRWIPRAVLWGYFAFMSLESLPGNQFWDRCLLLITDPRRRFGTEHTFHMFIHVVAFKTIFLYTALQLILLGGIWGVTQAGIFGIAFPLFIMALIPFREFIMPRLFLQADLDQLDSQEAVDEVAATKPPPPDPPSFLASSSSNGKPNEGSSYFSDSGQQMGDEGLTSSRSSSSIDTSTADAAVTDNFDTNLFTGRARHQVQRVATRRTAARLFRRYKQSESEQREQRAEENAQFRTTIGRLFGRSPESNLRRRQRSNEADNHGDVAANSSEAVVDIEAAHSPASQPPASQPPASPPPSSPMPSSPPSSSPPPSSPPPSSPPPSSPPPSSPQK